MPTSLGSLRRLLLTPQLAEVTFAKRGFPASPQMALGVVFAVKARAYAGLVPDHTETTCSVLADISVDKAVALADATAVSSPCPGSEPPYELWGSGYRLTSSLINESDEAICRYGM